jgi:RND family efflux transporter MFP subunit
MSVRTGRGHGVGAAALVALVLAATASCVRPASERAAAEAPASWAVTAWGETYEVFPEIDALVAGAVATAHTHVTVLDGFAPLTEGTVEIVLAGGGVEQVFRASGPARPGIFNVEIRPERAGEYALRFRIRSAGGEEEIAGGTVRVGSAEEPGVLVAAAQPQPTVPGEPVAFLKEQQWRAGFATARVEAGSLSRSVRGLARVRPASGGEATITAPVSGVLRARPWPHLGQTLRAGEILFDLIPAAAATESLAALGAAVRVLEGELEVEAARRRRLEELLALEAASVREVEEARARAASTAARLEAARRDLDAARAVRQGSGDADRHALRAPFAGAVASVAASPGAAVAAGDALARLVRTDPVWLEVELRPEQAVAVSEQGVAALLFAGDDERRLAADGVRVVARAPEVDAARGTATVVLETAGGAELLLGSTLDLEVLLPEPREGIVVPTSALVDDGGVFVAYVQLEGESFVRREVEVVDRQGTSALVEGLAPGQRLVTIGGDAIRRASLLSSGEVEGHVH